MFQAYLVTCIPSGRHYVGITSASLRRRWTEHVSHAMRSPRKGLLYAAIRKYGADKFTMTPLCSTHTWSELCAVEAILIEQWKSLAPNGYNLTLGGEGRYGFKPTAESVEHSAAKHRGKPCHPNTRRISSEFHIGKPKPPEHRAKIVAAKRGKPRSEETKAKLAAYWAARRKRGEFKTATPYANSRKAASAMIAKIPEPLARHIAQVFRPEGPA